MADPVEVAAELAASEAGAQTAAAAAQTAVAAAETAVVMAQAQTAQVAAQAAEEINDAQRDMRHVKEELGWMKEKTTALEARMEATHLSTMEALAQLQASVLAMAPVTAQSQGSQSQSPAQHLPVDNPQSADAVAPASSTPEPQASPTPETQASPPPAKKKYRRL